MRTVRRTRALSRAAAVAISVAFLSTGCSVPEAARHGSAPEPAPRSSETTTPGAPGTVVSCPGTDPARQHVTTFTATSPGAPQLEADLVVHDLGRRRHCAQPTLWSSGAVGERITEYRLDLPADADNYGERYTTSDRAGSVELLHFPFQFGTYGPCRRVTATLVLAGRGSVEHTYVARGAAGPRCD